MIFTSATTVTTVNYLSLPELEKYKKQFQGFWIPFMEQFIPATTVWVAGERWCNDPCPVINPCDYDFEYVEGDVSVIELPKSEPPPKAAPSPEPKIENSAFAPKGYRTTAEDALLASAKSVAGSASGADTTNSPQMVQTTDLGLTSSTTVLKTQAESSIDILSYRNKFTQLEIQTV